MTIHFYLSLDHFYYPSLLILIVPIAWAISSSTSSSWSEPYSSYSTLLSILSLCSFALFYLYRHNNPQLYSHQHGRKTTSSSSSTHSSIDTFAVVLQRFISLEDLGEKMIQHTTKEPEDESSSLSPSIPSHTAKNDSSSSSGKIDYNLDHNQEHQQHHLQCIAEELVSSLSVKTMETTKPTISSNPLDAQKDDPSKTQHQRRTDSQPESTKHTTDRKRKESISNQTLIVDIIPKEEIEALWTHPDYRIWDYIVVGEGNEALESASRLAQNHSSKTILVLLESDLRPNTTRRLILWTRRKLTTFAQRLWRKEALRAVPYLLHNNSIAGYPTIPIPAGNYITRESRRDDGTFEKENPIDLLSLPSNVCIGSRIGATKILVDRPITSQAVSTTMTASAMNSSNNSKPNPIPVRRFSAIGGESRRTSLTINTSTLVPSRTIGLEVASTNDPQDARYRLFCKDRVIFVNDNHPLVNSLERTTSPSSTSRDGLSLGVGGRRASAQISEDPTQSRKMVFSIRMKYRRTQPPFQSQRQSWDLKYYRLLNSLSFYLDRISNQNNSHNNNKNTTPEAVMKKRNNQLSGTRQSEQALTLNPVTLNQSQWVVQNGRVSTREQHVEDTDSDDDNSCILNLSIAASSASMETSEPIQILVRVDTQPTVNEAFGNADIIRKGEAVLMEGLGLARQMACTAGWTCLEEDDSHMVEWVRDQMNIQWSFDPQPSTLQPVSPTVEGLEMYTRTRTLSSTSIRVRTPNLSPYPSRTASFNGKRRDNHGMNDKRDSTLRRLQNVTETLNAQEEKGSSEIADSSTLQSSKVTIAATENSTLPALAQKVKGSFGGFSSLSSSRNQALALAESTEDRLGMSLSLSPLARSNSSKDRGTPPTSSQENLGSFSEGVGPLDLLGTDPNKDLSPKPSSLSKFSIKTYQMERSNNGLLGNDWAFSGGLGGLNISSAGSGAIAETNTTTTISDVSLTPPLIADSSLSGSVSPLTPSPKTGGEFLPGLSSPKSYSVSRFSFGGVNRFSGIGGGASGTGGGGSEEVSRSTIIQDSKITENSNNRRKSNISNFSNFSSTRVGMGTGPTHQPSEERSSNEERSFSGGRNGRGDSSVKYEDAEEVHDFLGKSIGQSPAPSFKAKFERSPRIPDGTFSQSLPIHYSSMESSGTTKSVQFADFDGLENGNENDNSNNSSSSSSNGNGTNRVRFQRTQSEPVIGGESEDLSTSPTNSTGSLSSSFSKSKAHTRRSWGQGIGGNDILGIQGLE